MALYAVACTSPRRAALQPLLPVRLDVERRPPGHQLEEAAELGLHPRGVLAGGVGEAERIGGLAEPGEAGIGAQADDQPDRALGGADGQQLESGHFEPWRGVQPGRCEHGASGRTARGETVAAGRERNRSW